MIDGGRRIVLGRDQRRPWRRKSIVLALTGVFLAWEVISRSLAAYLAEATPELALWLRADQPTALLNIADSKLNHLDQPTSGGDGPAPRRSVVALPDNQNLIHDFTAFDSLNRNADESQSSAAARAASSSDPPQTSSGADDKPVAEIRRWATSAIMEDPVNARAFRILGQLADSAKMPSVAEGYMHAAARRSLNESVAVYWMMQYSASQKDFEAMLYYADVILRTHPELAKLVVPLLGRLAEDKDGGAALKHLLITDPPWRSLFFSMLPTSVRDARVPLDLLLALRSSPHPPLIADLREYLQVLIYHKLYELAYYTWLQFLAPDQLADAGLLFNGNFAVAPSGLPFDWLITPGSGVTVDIVPLPEEKEGRALFVDFEQGRVEYTSVNQLVVLAPGTYRLTGRYKGQLIGPRGLKWRVACADDAAAVIGESDMIIGAAPKWRSLDLSFTVPPGSCRAQFVRLDLDARMASERLVSGSVWFGNLAIARTAQSVPPPQR